MIQITRLSNHYRIAGQGSAVAQATRRLDHVCKTLLAQALEGPARDFADPDGPVLKVRKLNLRLWLDMARRSDGQIAEDWARLLARALHRQLAEAGPENVMRYPSQAAFLAAWSLSVLGGTASDRWVYAEFALLHDLPKGRAISTVLSRHPDHILATFRALAGQGQRDRLIAALGPRDIAVLWVALTGAEPRRADALPLALLQALPTEGLTAPPQTPATAQDRVRTALRWLLTLTSAPASLTAHTAAPLAMQLTQVTALFHVSPALRALWVQTRPDAAAIRAALATLSPDLAAAGTWAATLMARSDTATARQALAKLVPQTRTEATAQTPAKARKPQPDTRILTPFAGAALLLPALRIFDPETQLTTHHRHHLLCTISTGPDRLLARGDYGLRQLSGLPPDTVLDPAPETLADDLEQILATFRQNLRGMARASQPYLTNQFFTQPGAVILGPRLLTVRIHSVPLKVLLQLSGRLGEQGTLPWLDDIPLRIEVGDG